MTAAGPDTDVLLDRAASGDGRARQQLLERFRRQLRRMVSLRLDHRLAARAVEVLRRAVAKGLANAGRMSTDTDFDPLRQRNEFCMLTADLTAATPDSHVDGPQP
jgi:hypothetical protein